MRFPCFNSVHRLISAPVLALACLIVTHAAYAAPIWLVDFGGSGTNPSAGGTWNVIKAGTTGDVPVTGAFTINDSTNTPANQLQINFVDDMDDNHGTQANTALKPQTSPLSDNGAWVDNNILLDYILLASSIPNTTGQFTIGNLDPAKTYSIELVSARATTANDRVGTLLVNGVKPDNFATSSVNSKNNTTIAAWAQVAPVSGSITVDVGIAPSSTFAYLNGMRISEVVPEPASLGLLTFAAFGLATRRRTN